MQWRSSGLIYTATLGLAMFGRVPCAVGEKGATSDPNRRSDDHSRPNRFDSTGFNSEKIGYLDPKLPSIKLPSYGGQRYEAVVPGTLDLAAMAKLSVHGLTSVTDPKADYEIYWRAAMFGNRPVMYRDLNHQVQLIMQRGVPLDRLISGSSENLAVEKRWLDVLFQLQAPDGLLYYPLAGRPWITYKGTGRHTPQYDEFEGDQYTGPLNNGWSAELFGLYYRLTGDEQFKQAGQKLVDGMIRQAVHREDYAFFPKGIYGLCEKSPPNMPIPPISKNCQLAWASYGLAQFYRFTGYKPALDLSGKVSRFVWKHGNVFGADGEWLMPEGHVPSHAGALFGLLEYAILSGDRQLIEFVRKGYEFGKAPAQNGNTLLGWFPEFAYQRQHRHSPMQTGEICSASFMIDLALELTRTEAGDYWDDVDRYMRNHFAESQLTTCQWMYEMARSEPATPIDPIIACDDKVGEKNLGNWASFPMPNDWSYGGVFYMHCCSGEGSGTLYRVWQNILHWRDSKLKVNLLINRASPWADIDSSIPYQGRVDVKIKKPCELSMRIPEWVTPKQTNAQVNGTDRPVSWDGRYAVVGKVEANDVVTATFPIFERTNVVEIQRRQYTLIRKGNDVVHIEPPGKNNPFYQRDKYRESKVPTKRVERFVAGQQIEW